MSNPQTLLITGACAGVGRATAVAFAERGWNVALIARGNELAPPDRRDNPFERFLATREPTAVSIERRADM